MSRKSKMKAIHEMRREQSKTSNVIPTAPFIRIVQELAQKHMPDVRFKKEAMQALQVDAESFIIDTLYRANTLAVESGRETLSVHDMRLVRRLRTDTIT